MAIPVTIEGKKKLQDDLQKIDKRIPLVRKAIEEAREKGDLKENAEYHAAREELALLQSRKGELASKIAQAVVVDESQIDHNRIAFSATVTLVDLSDNSEEDWVLVGEGEDDPLENKILTTSPMGQALIGHSVEDEITVEAPAGQLKFRVKAISY